MEMKINTNVPNTKLGTTKILDEIFYSFVCLVVCLLELMKEKKIFFYQHSLWFKIYSLKTMSIEVIKMTTKRRIFFSLKVK